MTDAVKTGSSLFALQPGVFTLLRPRNFPSFQFATVIALTVAAPFFETASAALLGGFVAFALSHGEIASKASQLVATMLPASIGVTGFAGTVAAVFIARSAIALAQGVCIERLSRDYQRALSAKLMRRYLAMPLEFHVQNNTAILIANVTLEARQVAGLGLQTAITVVSETLVTVMLAVLLFYIDPIGALVLFGVLGIALLFMVSFLPKAVAAAEKARHETAVHATKLAQTLISGFREILVGGTPYLLRQFDDATAAFADRAGRGMVLTLLPRAVLENLVLIALLAIVVYDGAVRQPANIAAIAVFVTASFRLIPSLMRLSDGGVFVVEAFAKLRQLTPGFPPEGDVFEAQTTAPAFSEFAMTGLHYSYNERARPVLSNLDFTLRRGVYTGLNGVSGAGKTTLLNILVGLLPAQQGVVCLNGSALYGESGLRQLRVLSAYVPQSIYIADDTLLNNITLGHPPEAIDRGKLDEAIEISQLAALVTVLPEGLITMIGERGKKLSGGEAQRVGIARALYQDRPILVLDEATSLLDLETEERILSALVTRRPNTTLVMVSHRPSALAHCHRLYRLDAGALTAS